jgi:hypothetical protein
MYDKSILRNDVPYMGTQCGFAVTAAEVIQESGGKA